MKLSLGILAILVGFYSYLPYIRDIFRGKTKPHAFSWLVWSLLTGIGCAAQVHDHAGAGAWVTGLSALVCFFIFIAALYQSEKNITRFDWFCLGGAFLALCLWAATDKPVFSVVLVSIIDALGFAPTFRKTFHRPDQETAIQYTLAATKYVIAILALDHFSITTTLYPASVMLMNVLFVTMLFIRRKQLIRARPKA